MPSGSFTERRNAARKAAGQLMRAGLDYGRDLKPPEAIEWLADVAFHVGNLDPIEIGAGAILKSRGHVRDNEQLTLQES